MKKNQTEGPITGRILEIQRMSTEDGPGLRTTVFFKGCPLACRWCHNPESIPPQPQLQWTGISCIGCGICVAACPVEALGLDEKEVRIHRDLCTGCGTCAEECPSGAMELLGTSWESGALVRELAKDQAYFDQSKGGVTLSGGEATMQPTFCRAVLEGLEQEGIERALDTCGQVSRRVLEDLLPRVDVLLFDLKEMDPKRHRAFTGRDNELILENLKFLGTFARERGPFKQFWVRTPIIPGATARRENIMAMGAFIAEHLDGVVDRWELCAFNNLCRDKYRRLDLEWEFDGTPLLSRDRMESFAAVARMSGVNPSLVSWSGSTLKDRDDDGMRAASAGIQGC